MPVDVWLNYSWTACGKNPLEPIHAFPVNYDSQQRRRLSLCTWDVMDCGLLALLYQNDAFDWIELRDVTVRCPAVMEMVEYMGMDLLPQPQTYVAIGGLFGHYRVSRDILTVQLVGPGHILKGPDVGVWPSTRPADFDNLDDGQSSAERASVMELFRLITSNMAHLTKSQTQYMLRRLRLCDEQRVQVAVNWLLKVFERNRPAESVWSLDFAACSPMIGRVLSCYHDAVEFACEVQPTTVEGWIEDHEPITHMELFQAMFKE